MKNFAPQAILMLQDGTAFKGNSIGKTGTTTGEICFNTGMTGYQEIYTDPSYFGQIVVNTNSHIGNYGVNSAETESASIKISGLVVKTFADVHSRQQADESLQKYLEKAGIVGICNLDTRHLVKHIRETGAMNAIISTEFEGEKLREILADTVSMDGLELSSKICTKEPYFVGNPDSPIKVAVLDFGIKTSILENMAKRNIYCQVFPAKTTFEEMEKWQPNGYFLSNGPGDPAVMDYAIQTVKQILEADKAVFGICLGHQLLALAAGIPTFKMHHGHRGLNHPVKNLITGRCEITSQNHGFSVSMEDVQKSENVILTHTNLNDNTVEGIKLKDKKAFSVQYHPESAPGPHDSRYLFDDFLTMMQE
ncbi:MAG: carbamoyl-phosphate synthase small subunit [Bacteroidetes bacterium]|nr:MAG: carbamoyl-phosphate synthase small subunit [Bacteroidota bacterium]